MESKAGLLAAGATFRVREKLKASTWGVSTTEAEGCEHRRGALLHVCHA